MSSATRRLVMGWLAGVFTALCLVGIWLIVALPYKIIPGSIAASQESIGISLAVVGASMAVMLLAVGSIVHRPRETTN